MRLPQLAGVSVTAAIVAGVDLPVDWLCALAVLCGGVATFVASALLGTRS